MRRMTTKKDPWMIRLSRNGPQCLVLSHSGWFFSDRLIKQSTLASQSSSSSSSSKLKELPKRINNGSWKKCVQHPLHKIGGMWGTPYRPPAHPSCRVLFPWINIWFFSWTNVFSWIYIITFQLEWLRGWGWLWWLGCFINNTLQKKKDAIPVRTPHGCI